MRYVSKQNKRWLLQKWGIIGFDGSVISWGEEIVRVAMEIKVEKRVYNKYIKKVILIMLGWGTEFYGDNGQGWPIPYSCE